MPHNLDTRVVTGIISIRQVIELVLLSTSQSSLEFFLSLLLPRFEKNIKLWKMQ